MATNFPRQIYDESKKLFPNGDVETFVSREHPSPGTPFGAVDPAVRLVHIPTGIEITCADFPSQTENYIAAVIRLSIACDKRDT